MSDDDIAEEPMACFRTFTLPLREIFGGNLLLLLCCLCYCAWWIMSFRPGSTGSSAGLFYLAAAFITGTAAIILMSYGIDSLSHESITLSVKYILLGTALVFFFLLMLTAIVFRRPVTSELFIIHVWAALELSAVAVLYGTGRFGTARAGIMLALIGIATIIALICYALYYRLDATARLRVGVVPLATDAFVVAVFQILLATL